MIESLPSSYAADLKKGMRLETVDTARQHLPSREFLFGETGSRPTLRHPQKF
jgi:hypothetical protein